MLLMMTHDIAKGAVAALVARSFEPSITPVSPLPNPTLLAPTLRALASGSPQ
jgi:hypothetical protein